MIEPSPKPATPEVILPPNEPPGLTEAVRFLYKLRVRIAVRFFLLFVIGLVAFLYWYSFASKMVEGTIALTFRGMERHEYPNGKKFTVEDFRSPDLLTDAMADLIALCQSDVMKDIDETDRQNFAKFLMIVRVRLENAIGVVKRGQPEK